MSRPFSGIYINPNITSPSKAGIGLQPPPPMMRGPMMMDRRRLVGLAIVVGLVFLLAGAILADESHARPNPGQTQGAFIAPASLGLRRRPAVARIVMLLTGLISRSMVAVVGTAPAITAITLAALVLVGVGGFFVTLALFLGAYTASGESWTTTVWRIAQLLAAVLILMFVF